MQQNTIVIEQQESGSATYPDILTSGGLWPCIAIGILDTKKRVAYMLHEPNASVDENIKPFLNQILSKHKKENLKVYVTGGRVLKEEDETQRRYVAEQKSYVEEILKQTFEYEQITFNWADNFFCELIIDTATGEFIVEETD
jgi:hypothetical protein